jgi:hypothetical protein
MDIKASAFIQNPSVTEYVPTACFVHVQTDRLPADWTLGNERMQPPPAQHFQKLAHP